MTVGGFEGGGPLSRGPQSRPDLGGFCVLGGWLGQEQGVQCLGEGVGGCLLQGGTNQGGGDWGGSLIWKLWGSLSCGREGN